MMTCPETSVEKCPRCGADLGDHAAYGFCSRCAASVSLAESDADSASEEELAVLLPRTALAGGTRAAFGDYELLDEIARGGMGVVYRARQRSLNRIVAVKMVLFGGLAGPEALKRFRAEAAAASALEHPNIVRILDVGEQAGQPFLAMEYVAGRDLARWVSERPLAPRQAAGYLEKIARAVEFAHQRGVLHRDLKPSNVLVDAFDEPRVTDFGLAKRLADSQPSTLDPQLTLTGQTLGSASFMPPEQARGDARRVGPASDVYGLGAMLYHLLTGRPPFLAETFEATLRQVLERDPVAPRQFNPNVPADLETICLKCLEKEPARRYPTAQELAGELGRFLKDEPILARPIGLAGKAWRWCRRKPVVASLSATSFALVLAVAIGAPIMAYRINEARLAADQERLVADQERLQTQQSLYASDMRLASEAVRQGRFNHARELLEQHSLKPGQEDLRGFEWRYLAKAVQDSEPIRTLEGLPAPRAWGETRLFRSEHYLYNQSGDQLKELKAWDMTTWEPVPLVPPAQASPVHWQWDPERGSAYALDGDQHTVAVYALPQFALRATVRLPGPISPLVRISDAQTRLAVGYQEGVSHRVMVWDLERDAALGPLGDFEAGLTALVFSHDGKRLAASSTNGVIGVWDLSTLQPLPAPPGNTNHATQLHFAADNKRLLYGDDPHYSVWDIEAAQRFRFERWSEGELSVAGASPDARYFVLSRGGWDLTLVDSTTFLVKGTLRGSSGRMGNVKFSPDGRLIAVASTDQVAHIWDLATRTEVGILGGFGQGIYSVEFSADGQDIALLGGFGAVRIYRLAEVLDRGLFAPAPGKEPLIDLAISPDERRLATIGPGGMLAVWDRQSRRLLRSVRFPRYTPSSFPRVVFSPDGERVFWVTGDALRIMQVESNLVRAIPTDGNREANALTFSAEGGELAFGCGKALLIYEPASEQLRRFAATDDEVDAIRYSPDGRLLAFGDRRGTVTLCERASGRVLSKQEQAHPPYVCGVEFSPDGRLLATSGADSSIKLWRVQPDGLQWRQTLRGHMGYVNILAFSPDGTRLVSPSADRTLKIWDPHRGAELATLYGHHDLVNTARFTRDGRTLYSVGMDGEIRFWEAPPIAQIDLSPKRAPAETRPTKPNQPK